jgi:hypothetical protein
MPESKFRIGDKVKMMSMPPVTFAPGVKDELGTKKLFKSMLGKVYTVRGFDKYGNVKLEPKRLNTVWVEPQFLKFWARKTNRRRAK